MANVISVGAIGPVYLLRLGPSDNTLDEKSHELSCPSLVMRRIVERIHI